MKTLTNISLASGGKGCSANSREDTVFREDAQYNIRFTMDVFGKEGPPKKHFISQTVVSRLLLAGCRATYL